MEETGKMVGHKFSTLSKAKRSYENESSSADDDSGIESRIREIEGELAELADCAANLQGIAEEISGLRAIIEDIQCRTEITDRIRKLEVVLGVEDNTTGKSNGKSDLDAALGL